MPARCQVTGRTPGFGNHVSHSHRRTPRRFDPNVQTRRYWSPVRGRTVRLHLTPAGMRLVDRRGVDAVLDDLARRGERF